MLDDREQGTEFKEGSLCKHYEFQGYTPTKTALLWYMKHGRARTILFLFLVTPEWQTLGQYDPQSSQENGKGTQRTSTMLPLRISESGYYG